MKPEVAMRFRKPIIIIIIIIVFELKFIYLIHSSINLMYLNLAKQEDEYDDSDDSGPDERSDDDRYLSDSAVGLKKKKADEI